MRSTSTPIVSASRAAHVVAAVGDPRRFTDQDTVGVDELETGIRQLPVGVAQQEQRRHASEGVVLRREERADVAEAGSSEQCVDQRVRDDIAVRVPGKASILVKPDAAEDKWNPVGEGVRVNTEPHAQIAQPSSSWRACRPSKTVTVS